MYVATPARQVKQIELDSVPGDMKTLEVPGVHFSSFSDNACVYIVAV